MVKIGELFVVYTYRTNIDKKEREYWSYCYKWVVSEYCKNFLHRQIFCQAPSCFLYTFGWRIATLEGCRTIFVLLHYTQHSKHMNKHILLCCSQIFLCHLHAVVWWIEREKEISGSGLLYTERERMKEEDLAVQRERKTLRMREREHAIIAWDYTQIYSHPNKHNSF